MVYIQNLFKKEKKFNKNKLNKLIILKLIFSKKLLISRSTYNLMIKNYLLIVNNLFLNIYVKKFSLSLLILLI